MIARISNITLADAGLRAPPAEIQQELRVAIFDLLEDNSFSLRDGPDGPYRLTLGRSGATIHFAVADENELELNRFPLPHDPFRQTIKDYGLICASYYEAVKTAAPLEIERMDEARRAIHAEGGRLVRTHIDLHAEVDEETARRLFTLLCALSA